MYYKNIIVGGGIAGLTLGFYLQKLGEPYLLLEKESSFGGRAKNVDFHGVNIPLGAGVIRQEDKCIRDLVKELGLTLSSWESDMKLHPTIHISEENKAKMISQLKKVYDGGKFSGTFRQFINLNFTAEFIMKFEQIVGHNDFWGADVNDVMKHYPFNELLVFPSTISAVVGGWNVVIDALVKNCDKSSLRTNEPVVEIDCEEKLINNKYTYDRLFLCGDATLKVFAEKLPKKIGETLNHISSVPFIRLYTLHPEKFTVPFLKVPTILQKMIPITDTVLMSAYTENYQAETLKEILEKKKALRDINSLIKNSIYGSNYTVSKATDFTWKWWEHGIHYYKPHAKQLVKWENNVYLLGEMGSDNQGWVEGAIESVYAVICELFSEKCL